MSDESKVEGPDSTGEGEEAKAAQEDPAVVEDDDVTHAADEATDVWDEDSLRAAGLGDLLDQEARAEAKAKGQQKMAAPQVSTDSSAGTPGEKSTGPDTLPPPPGQGQAGLSWGATIALAVVLGAAVFFLVKLLR